jgi:hypothetical protein
MIHLVAGWRCRPIARLTSPGQHAGCPWFIPVRGPVRQGRVAVEVGDLRRLAPFGSMVKICMPGAPGVGSAAKTIRPLVPGKVAQAEDFLAGASVLLLMVGGWFRRQR